MAGARKLAVGSGAAFTVGAIAGVVGNNLAQGPWYWAGFCVLAVVGAGLSGWLTYRGAASSGLSGVSHVGDNTIRRVKGGGSGPTIGVSYGEASGGPGKGTP